MVSWARPNVDSHSELLFSRSCWAGCMTPARAGAPKPLRPPTCPHPRRAWRPQELRLLAAVVAKNAVGSNWRKVLATREWSRVPGACVRGCGRVGDSVGLKVEQRGFWSSMEQRGNPVSQAPREGRAGHVIMRETRLDLGRERRRALQQPGLIQRCLLGPGVLERIQRPEEL